MGGWGGGADKMREEKHRKRLAVGGWLRDRAKNGIHRPRRGQPRQGRQLPAPAHNGLTKPGPVGGRHN